MLVKEITYSNEAKIKLKKGVDTLANAVKVTLGPSGRNVLLERKFAQPHITKDGVTVARDIYLEDPIENMGATMVKTVASKTNDIAGDGTTTATVLAQAMFNKGYQLTVAGINPMLLKKGMDAYTNMIVQELKKMALTIEYGSPKMTQIATISANGDLEIGKNIADAISIVKSDGEVTIEDARGVKTEIDIVQGMQFDKGYESPYFINDLEKMEVSYEDAYILLYDGKLEKVNEMIPILEKVATTHKPLLIITNMIIGDALQALILNKVKAQYPVVVVTAPSFGDNRKEILEDIAYLTGGRVISTEIDDTLEKATLDDLGRAEKILVKQKSTLIVGGKGTMVEERITSIKAKMEMKDLNDYDKKSLKERLAKLTGGVAVIKVGAISEVELKEKKDRYIDALSATKAAMEEGIVAGGGVALIEANLKVLKKVEHSFDNDAIGLGMKIISDSISSPLENIVINSGYSADVVITNITNNFKKRNSKKNYGINGLTGKYGDMIEMGVIDPVKVTRTAIENASSVASMLLTTECVVNDIPKDEPDILKQPNTNPLI